MRALIRFELKKIVNRRITAFALLSALLLNILFFGLGVVNEVHFSFISEEDRLVQKLHGLEAIRFEREEMVELKGYLTDTYLKQREAERKAIESNPRHFEKIPDHELEEKKKRMREEGFSEKEIANIPVLKLKDDVYIHQLDKYDMLRSHLYIRIPEIIAELKKGDLSGIAERRSGKYRHAQKPTDTKEEISKLLRMYEQIPTPFYYDYYIGWERLSSGFSWIVAILLGAVIVICLSPVFSQEYSFQTDAIILTSKLGKSKLIVAKLLSSFLFTTAVYLFFAALNLGLYAAVYGLSGSKSPIQLEFFYSQSPYSLTFLEFYLSILGLSYIGLILLTAVTLSISSKGKSPFICVILSALVLYLPLIDLRETSYFAYKIMSLFPVNMMNAADHFELGTLYNLSGIIITQPTMMVMTAFFACLLLVPLTYRSFRSHPA